jgi:hypothetical protein
VRGEFVRRVGRNGRGACEVGNREGGGVVRVDDEVEWVVIGNGVRSKKLR